MKPRRNLLVGIDVMAGALAMSRRQVYQLITEGVLPKATARGKYDLPLATSSYVEHLRSERGEPDVIALRRTRAERAELELVARRRELARDEIGPLIPLAEAKSAFSTAVEQYVGALSHLAAAAAPKLVGIDDPKQVYAILDPLVVATINEGWRRAWVRLGVDPGAPSANGHAGRHQT